MSELLGLILLVSFIAGFLIIAAEDFIWDCLVKQIFSDDLQGDDG